jgi:hypothetical protein
MKTRKKRNPHKEVRHWGPSEYAYQRKTGASKRMALAKAVGMYSKRNPRKVKGHSTILRNMAVVTITKQRNGVVKITGRKMAGRKNVGGVQYVAYEDNRSGGRPFKVARAASFQGRGRIIAGPTTKNIASGAAALANKLERLKRGKR